jgi:anti-sigma factor RsiW
MDCKTALALLGFYLDKELDRADARQLEAHVDDCADCRAALTRLDALRVALRDAELRHPAPQALRERLLATRIDSDAAEPFPPPQTARRAASSWLRMAAVCVLAFGAGSMATHLWNFRQDAVEGQEQIARDLFASHWRALAAASPVDVVSSDRHTVKPWFAGKIAEAPRVADFVDQGFALAGARIDYVGSERVAVLVYRHGQHVIDVFVLPHTPLQQLASPARNAGYTTRGIMLGAQTAAIVSDLDEQELDKFLRLLDAAR